MKGLRIWMVSVGIFYILNLILLWPSIWSSQLPGMYPNVELYQGEAIFQLLLDAWLIVGLGLAAIGVVLLVGSRQPDKYSAGLVPIVLITETLFGIWDIYSAMNDEVLWMAMATLVIHIIIIASGVWVWKNAKQ
ncbi:MAG: BphX family protein [Cycloclasticus sp.]|nr:BphX family protein [Cycloclasticus sp.]